MILSNAKVALYIVAVQQNIANQRPDFPARGLALIERQERAREQLRRLTASLRHLRMRQMRDAFFAGQEGASSDEDA